MLAVHSSRAPQWRNHKKLRSFQAVQQQQNIPLQIQGAAPLSPLRGAELRLSSDNLLLLSHAFYLVGSASVFWAGRTFPRLRSHETSGCSWATPDGPLPPSSIEQDVPHDIFSNKGSQAGRTVILWIEIRISPSMGLLEVVATNWQGHLLPACLPLDIHLPHQPCFEVEPPPPPVSDLDVDVSWCLFSAQGNGH